MAAIEYRRKIPGVTPLVSMSDKRLGGIANSSLSNLRAIWLLASSTSFIRYPRVSLSARSLCPPLSCTAADLRRTFYHRFRWRTEHVLRLEFLVLERKRVHGCSPIPSEWTQTPPPAVPSVQAPERVSSVFVTEKCLICFWPGDGVSIVFPGKGTSPGKRLSQNPVPVRV